jgi:hypothetical protein
VSAIKRLIAEDPGKFVAIAANKIPGEVEVTSSTYVIVAPSAAESTEEWLSQLSIQRPDQTLQ